MLTLKVKAPDGNQLTSFNMRVERVVAKKRSRGLARRGDQFLP